jgi:hypothetical protein
VAVQSGVGPVVSDERPNYAERLSEVEINRSAYPDCGTKPKNRPAKQAAHATDQPLTRKEPIGNACLVTPYDKWAPLKSSFEFWDTTGNEGEEENETRKEQTAEIFHGGGFRN